MNVENSFDFTWESPENGPTTIDLDADVDTFKGQADLIARRDRQPDRAPVD